LLLKEVSARVASFDDSRGLLGRGLSAAWRIRGATTGEMDVDEVSVFIVGSESATFIFFAPAM
jgi:hypothetical protein